MSKSQRDEVINLLNKAAEMPESDEKQAAAAELLELLVKNFPVTDDVDIGAAGKEFAAFAMNELTLDQVSDNAFGTCIIRHAIKDKRVNLIKTYKWHIHCSQYNKVAKYFWFNDRKKRK